MTCFLLLYIASGKAIGVVGRRLEGLSKSGVPFIISISVTVEKQGKLESDSRDCDLGKLISSFIS